VANGIVAREGHRRLGAVLPGAVDLHLGGDQPLGGEPEEQLPQERDRGAGEAGPARDGDALLALGRRLAAAREQGAEGEREPRERLLGRRARTRTPTSAVWARSSYACGSA